MTNTQKIVNATRNHVGHVLSAKMVQALVLAMYPETNAASIMVSDHAGANSKGITYASQVFDRVPTGYLVRADVIVKATKARGQVSMADALAQANALLQASPTQEQAIVDAAVIDAPTDGEVQASA